MPALLVNPPIVKKLLMHIKRAALAIVGIVISPTETQDKPEWANLIRWAWSERSFLGQITGRGLTHTEPWRKELSFISDSYLQYFRTLIENESRTGKVEWWDAYRNEPNCLVQRR